MAPAMGGSTLLWIALLLFSLDDTLAATGKSILSLNPPWYRIFRGENVTLTCHGNDSLEDSHTKWFHNGSISEETRSHLDIVNANFQHSGKYKCQNQDFYKSEPVYLEVFSDWLLLQASAEVVVEGKPLTIRCHGWRNWKVRKTIYYKDGIAFQYFYENNNISITNVTLNDSGIYHCSGEVRRLRYGSEHLRITVLKVHQSEYYWLQFIIQFLVVTLFAVDTGLLLSTQEEFRSILKMQERLGKPKKIQTHPPKPDSQGN